jgi:hypothetical protein
MSLALIEAEIRRFLANEDPEVLCIKGKWGVGKTYAWKKYLADALKERRLSFKDYSYVSLFGLNSLEDLRYAIFENTITTDNLASGPSLETFGSLITKAKNAGRKGRAALEFVLPFLRAPGVASTIFKSAFLLVRKQLVCLDDLERAGKGLDARDVLGLVSFLKEERKCKIVLLLNDEQMETKEREEFDKQLEKVADVFLVFDLSPEEAVRIALPANNGWDEFLGSRITALGITNIRVIKKIERIAARLVDLLRDFDKSTIEQAIATAALAGWSVHQPNAAPPLDFIRKYSRLGSELRDAHEQVAFDTQKWEKALENYRYADTDDLDAVILDGAACGFFDEERLKEKAAVIQKQLRHNSRDNSFSRTWKDLYHGSLVTEDDVFLDKLYRAAVENCETISPLNMNGAVRILREYGRDEQASDLIGTYIEARSGEDVEFFDLDNHHFFADDPVDEAFREAFARRLSEYVDTRKPLDVLRTMGKRGGWNDADVRLLAKLSSSDLEQLFEELRGEDVRRSIEVVLAIGSGSPERATIRAAATDALRRIAAKSPMRARKIQRYGVSLEASQAPQL